MAGYTKLRLSVFTMLFVNAEAWKTSNNALGSRPLPYYIW